VSALDRFIAYQAENVDHADEDAKLEWECLIAELQDERDRLRAERDGWKKLCTDQEVMHVMREKTLDNENAKLRELISELWVSCPLHDSDCDECRHRGGRTGCELYDRMRELGVV